MESTTLEATEDLAHRLLEQVRDFYGEHATVERLVLVASVTQKDGAQRAVAVANGLPLYEQSGTLRHALSALTAPQRPEDRS